MYFRQIHPSAMAISTLRRHQANCGIFQWCHKLLDLLTLKALM